MFEFFQCWFLEQHPWNKNGTLKFMSPSLIWQQFTCDFKCASSMSGALSQAVQKKRKTLQILECKKQLYSSLLWKSEKVCHNCGTKQGHPLHCSVHALKQRQYGLLQAIPGCIIPNVVNRTFGNRTQSIGFDWVRLGSYLIALRKMFQFDYVRLPNQSNDCVQLVFGSVRGLTTPARRIIRDK